MPISVRLDRDTERLVTRLARTKATTKSDVIREAIKKLAEADQVGKPGATPYEAIKHLIGIGKGGPPDLSVRTGEKVRELLWTRYQTQQRRVREGRGGSRRGRPR